MAPLIVCSVLALAIIIERIGFWTGFFRQFKPAESSKVLKHWTAGRNREALNLAKNSSDLITQVLYQILQSKGRHIQQIVDINVSKWNTKMLHYMATLKTVISISPLLGILGTVVGIIDSFSVLGGAGLQDPKLVTGGIAQALVTTAMGLSIAVIALLFHNLFQSFMVRFVSRAEYILSEVELVFKAKQENENEAQDPIE